MVVLLIMIQEFDCTNTLNIQIFPLVAGNSSSIFVYTLVKLYNKASVLRMYIYNT